VIHNAGDQRIELITHPEVGETNVVQRCGDHTTHQLNGPPPSGPVHHGQRHHQQTHHDQDEGQWEDEGIRYAHGLVVQKSQHGQGPQDPEGAGDLQEGGRLQVTPGVNLEDQHMVDPGLLPSGHIGRHVEVEDHPGEGTAVQAHQTRGIVL